MLFDLKSFKEAPSAYEKQKTQGLFGILIESHNGKLMKERLKIIADSVNRGESMADIGTDHGFLPIFLLNEGICERAIATDISEAAIAKTREYSTDALKRGNLSLRCGSGIEVLEKGEVDIVVIAGMGGVLIAQILRK